MPDDAPEADPSSRSTVTIRVRYFAMQREQLGRRNEDLELPPGQATIGDAWSALVASHPVLEPASGTIRFARNGTYAAADEPLQDGDELALIPPVAGGGTGGDAEPRLAPATDPRLAPTAEPPLAPTSEPPLAPTGAPRLALTADPIDQAAIAGLMAAVPGQDDGAVVVFIGRTRASPGTPAPGQEAEAARFVGRSVDALEYEAFEPMALAELARIASEIAEHHGVTDLAILHRTGRVPLGETSVVIVAAAPHRAAAFDACRYAIEELKARVPIWKSERFADGSVWLGAPPRPGPQEGA